jgi:putative sigma-54 modulation protein
MKYTSNYKNIKSSAALDADIQKTFGKFESYFDKDFICHATISHKGKGSDIKCVEITIRAGKYTFRAESVTDDFHKSVDENFEKIKKQVRRHKDKVLTRKRASGDNLGFWDETPIEEDENNEIKKAKRFKVMPMSVEEATMQMELLNHTFFVFLNAETDEINVVYKRDDGGFGIIEAER